MLSRLQYTALDTGNSAWGEVKYRLPALQGLDELRRSLSCLNAQGRGPAACIEDETKIVT